MDIVERASTRDGRPVTTYKFSGHEYTHVGSWPPIFLPGEFHIPLYKVFDDEGNDVTRRVSRFAGPRHVVTDETLRWAFGRWSWKPRVCLTHRSLRCTFRSVLTPCDTPPPVRVINVLGQESSFGAKKN